MTQQQVTQIRALETVKLPYGADYTKRFLADMINNSYHFAASVLLTPKQGLFIDRLIYRYRKQIPDWEKLTPVRTKLRV